MDRIEVELSESPAVPTNDTSTRSGGPSVTFDSSAQSDLSTAELSWTPDKHGFQGTAAVLGGTPGASDIGTSWWPGWDARC